MESLVEYMVKALVKNPDEIQISRRPSNDGTGYTIEVRVHPDDMGRIIGRQGRIARSIRTIVKSAAGQNGENVFVEII